MEVHGMADSKRDGRGGVTRKEKFLTFNLAGEQYGLEILMVREIIGLMDITTVPQTPDFVRGVINLRGKVIPIIDLRKKFGMQSIEDTEQTCIIVVDFMEDQNSIQMGIIVDSVSEVLDIDVNDIDDPPRFSTAVTTSFIKGIAKTKGGTKILLKIEDILTTDEIQGLPAAELDETR